MLSLMRMGYAGSQAARYAGLIKTHETVCFLKPLKFDAIITV